MNKVSNKSIDFRNMVDDPYLNAIKKGNRPPRKRSYPFNAGGSYNCCGFAATGDEEATAAAAAETAPVPAEVKSKVQNLKTWALIKTGLALVGLYVVGVWAYKKIKK